MLSPWMRIGLAALLLLTLANAHSADLFDWREYRSDHFLLYSDRNPKDAKTVLRDFERFRLAALTVLGLPDTAESEHTQIYLFKNAEHYRLIQPDMSIAGFYRDTMQGPRMVVGAEANLADISLVLFHEYSHHLIRSRNKIHYPLWYDEGFADLLASAEIHPHHVIIGLSNSWREPLVSKQRLLPLAELFKPLPGKASNYWERYYASAWMLMHYLQMEYTANDQRKAEDLRRFILALNSGADPIAEFAVQFDISLAQLQKQLEQYSTRRYWKGIKIDVARYRGPMTSRLLTRNEAAYLIGDLAYRAGQVNAAGQILQYIDASNASVAPALSLRAVVESHKHNLPVAQHFLKMATGMDADQPTVATNAAHFYWDKYLLHGAGKTQQEENQLLAKVSEYAQRALALDPNNLEAGRFLANAMEKRGDLSGAIAILRSIYQYRPTDIQLNLDLGKILVQANRANDARPYLKNVIAWDHSLLRRHQAQTLLSHAQNSDTMVVSHLDQSHRDD